MKRLLVITLLTVGCVVAGNAVETGVENIGTASPPVTQSSYWDVVDQYGNRGHFEFASLKQCQDFLASSGSVWADCVLINPQN